MLEIIPIPAFQDNYIWLISNGRAAAAVDPGEAAPLLDHLERHRLPLCAILITHHHRDHCGGIATLAKRFTLPVYGPRRENVAGVTQPVGEGDVITLPPLGIQLRVMEVPGHTAGHVAYYGINSLFCGDTLFAAGCGRLFEGSPAQMTASLARFRALPEETRVYCAHEYTLDNLRFARTAEPGNQALLQRERVEQSRRDEGQPTLPSTIGLEKRTNPFLRWDDPDLVAAATAFAGLPLRKPAEIFAAVRRWKDQLD